MLDLSTRRANARVRTRWHLCVLAFLVPAVIATSSRGADSRRTQQLRLLCVQLSGDLTEPGGLAAFRRCLSAHDPLAEMKRQNLGQHLGQRVVAEPIRDRPAAAPLKNFGRNSRTSVAQNVQQFETADGKVVYALATDGRLWRSTLGTKDVRMLGPSIKLFRLAGDGSLFVLHRDGALWHMDVTGAHSALVERGVADVMPLGGVLYVLDGDGKLWREAGGRREPVDSHVKTFQAIDAKTVYVLGRDGKLWRDGAARALMAGNVTAFQYVPDGDTLYVLTPVGGLWRKAGADKPEQADRNVAAFRAVDMNLLYVLGTDGRLWDELGNRDQAVLVDRELATALGRDAFATLDAHHVYLVDKDRKLWAETMPPGR